MSIFDVATILEDMRSEQFLAVDGVKSNDAQCSHCDNWLCPNDSSGVPEECAEPVYVESIFGGYNRIS